MECATPDKPEVLAITAKMGWDDPDLTVGKLFRLWRWFDQQTTNGNAQGVTLALLNRISGVNNFAEAMQSVGWLIVNDDGISLPGFEKHCGHSAKSRADTARRVAKHKAGKAEPKNAHVNPERALIPRPIRKAVIERDGGKCVYCGRLEGEYLPPETARDAFLHLDHVIPITQGGSDDILNLACSCGVCNQFKSNRNPDECGLTWPEINGVRLGNKKTVTGALPREEKRRKEKNKTKTFTSGDLSIAEFMFDAILRLNPDHKKPNLESWADVVRLMRERDNRSPPEIKSVFMWANNHRFWAKNILSPDKLREQFDKLVIQRDQESKNEIGQRNSAKPNINFDDTSWGDDLDAALNI